MDTEPKSISEMYKLRIPDDVLIFLSTSSDAQRVCIEIKLKHIGAKTIGPHCLSVESVRLTLEDIKATIGELQDKDCVYVMKPSEKGIETYLIVRPQTTGGIAVDQQKVAPTHQGEER